MTDSQLNLNFIKNNILSPNDIAGINNVDASNVTTELYATTMGWLFNATFNDSIFDPTTTHNPDLVYCDWNYAKGADNSHFNCNETDFILHQRGPRQLPLATALSVSKLSKQIVGCECINCLLLFRKIPVIQNFMFILI